MVPLASLAALIAVGLGVDFSGQTQAEQDLRDQVSYCARLATGQASLGASADRAAVSQAAQDCLTARGLTGTVGLTPARLTVTVQGEYPTKLLSIIGLDRLPVRAVGSAALAQER